MYTLKQDIQLFQNFAEAHAQIKAFGFGDPSLLTTTNHSTYDGTDTDALKYPLMFVILEGVNVSGSLHSRNYTIYFCDKLTKGGVNYKDVLNDTERLAHDLLAYLKKGDIGKGRDFDKNCQMTDFRDAFQDCLAGYSITITLTQAEKYDSCNIPFIDSIPDPDRSGGSILIKNSDNSFSHTATSSPYTLPDETVQVYNNSVLVDTVTIVTLGTTTINIES